LYGGLSWTAADLQTLAPRMTLEQAEEWFAASEEKLRDRLVEKGWEVLETMLAYDGVDTRDAGDDNEEEGICQENR